VRKPKATALVESTDPASRRTEAAERTRQALLEAGIRLADRTSLTELRVDAIVAEAGVSKGTFFHHFKDRAAYVNELLRAFHDELGATVRRAMDELPPGRERLLHGTNTFLDGCLGNRGVRALLLEMRAEPCVAAETVERNLAYARVCADDFKALGRASPLACAQLWIGATNEAAILEHRAGHRLPAVRSALSESLTPSPRRRPRGSGH
jgi:AcrR family transcriptional regulator